jgi:hypothetical protein
MDAIMESLAALVTVLLITIYGSGVIALALAWTSNRIAIIVSRVLSFIAMASGFWLGLTLMNGSSVVLGGIPVLLGVASLIISIRRNP